MKINQAYRYELKPNNKQVGLLVKTCGVARFAWNWGLAERIRLFEQNEGRDRFTWGYAQHKRLVVLKKTDYPWMYEVSNCAPWGALRDLEVAFKNFRRGRKNGNQAGFPRFKKKGIHDSFYLRGHIHLYNKGVKLPRLGIMRLKEGTSKFKGRILSATVSREADRWYVSLCVERERLEPEPNGGGIVGVDLGLNSFAVIHDGANTERVSPAKPLAKALKRLQRLARQHSCKQKGSNNRRKSTLCSARLHRKIRNRRKDYLHKLTSSLAKDKSVVVIEDLYVAGMVRNRHLARSIADAGWGEFRRMLEYKTKWYGSRLVVIDRFAPSSKTCSECGAVNGGITLSDRRWVCMVCGAAHDRDENAAKNIRQAGIAILDTERASGIHACGVARSPACERAGDGEAGSKHDSTLGVNR